MASSLKERRAEGLRAANKEIDKIMDQRGLTGREGRREAAAIRKAAANGTTEKHLEAKVPKRKYTIKTKLGPLLSPPKQTIEELMVTVKTRCGELADAIERHRNSLEQTQRELHQWTAVGRALGMEVSDTTPERD